MFGIRNDQPITLLSITSFYFKRDNFGNEIQSALFYQLAHDVNFQHRYNRAFTKESTPYDDIWENEIKFFFISKRSVINFLLH